MIVPGIVLKAGWWIGGGMDGNHISKISGTVPAVVAASVTVGNQTDSLSVELVVTSHVPAGSSMTWGERWRYDDPFHALGMLPVAGMAYRFGVIGGSYLLDLFTAEQQGITPISFEGKPGWSKSIL